MNGNPSKKRVRQRKTNKKKGERMEEEKKH